MVYDSFSSILFYRFVRILIFNVYNELYYCSKRDDMNFVLFCTTTAIFTRFERVSFRFYSWAEPTSRSH